MATLEDLQSRPLSDLSTDEAIELLRMIRLSRRTQKKPQKKKASKSTRANKKPEQMTPAMAKKLLELIGG